MEVLIRPGRVYHRLLINRLKFERLTVNPTITSRFNQTNAANYQIVTESPFKSSGSWFKKLQYSVGIGDVNVFALRRATIFQYQACTDKLSPELHVWMCQVRSMKEGPEGRTLRNEIIQRMWQDLDVRLSKIEVYSSSRRKALLNDLLYHHQGAMFSYDEGVLVDDKTLASALWRTLFSKDSVDPLVLEMAVKYVRTQMNHLRSIGPREWCLDGKFDWAPFPPLVVEAKNQIG